MSDKRFPEQARASPIPAQTVRLSARLSNGGETLHLERLVIVAEDDLSKSADSATLVEYEVEVPAETSPSEIEEVGKVSVMLLLQVATLLVAVMALFAAL